jgi:hypothetical protein
MDSAERPLLKSPPELAYARNGSRAVKCTEVANGRFLARLAPDLPFRLRPGPGVAGPAAMDQFTPYPVTSFSANQRIGGFRCALFFRRCSSSRSIDRLGWRTSISPNTIKIPPCCPSGLSVGGVWKLSCQQSLPDERIVSPNSDEFWIGLFLPWLTYVYHA